MKIQLMNTIKLTIDVTSYWSVSPFSIHISTSSVSFLNSILFLYTLCLLSYLIYKLLYNSLTINFKLVILYRNDKKLPNLVISMSQVDTDSSCRHRCVWPYSDISKKKKGKILYSSSCLLFLWGNTDSLHTKVSCNSRMTHNEKPEGR